MDSYHDAALSLLPRGDSPVKVPPPHWPDPHLLGVIIVTICNRVSCPLTHAARTPQRSHDRSTSSTPSPTPQSPGTVAVSDVSAISDNDSRSVVSDGSSAGYGGLVTTRSGGRGGANNAASPTSRRRLKLRSRAAVGTRSDDFVAFT